MCEQERVNDVKDVVQVGPDCRFIGGAITVCVAFLFASFDWLCSKPCRTLDQRSLKQQALAYCGPTPFRVLDKHTILAKPL